MAVRAIIGGLPPTTISGLQLWLKADSLALNDGDSVTTWADQSGNGNDATNTTPVPVYKTNIQNGLPVVRFTAASSQKLTLTNTITLNSDFTIFVVQNCTVDGSTTLSDTAGNNRVSNTTITGAVGDIRLNTTIFNLSARTNINVGFRVRTTQRTTNNNLYSFQDGLLSSKGAVQNSTNTFSLTTLGIGGASNAFGGDMCEILIYNRQLTLQELETVHEYLFAKWGMTLYPIRLPIRDFGTAMQANTGSQMAYSASTDFNPAGSFSIGAWAKTSSVVTTKALMGKGAATGGQTNYCYSIAFASPNLSARISKDTTTGTTFTTANPVLPLTDGRYHHIVLTYQYVADGTSIGKIYVDGVLAAINSTLPGPPNPSSTSDFMIGAAEIGATGHGSPTVGLSGPVDEAFFYNVVMTQAQIVDLALHGIQSTLVPMTDANLYGFWTFDEGAGTTTVDKSSRGNNLTLNSSASWSLDVVTRPRLAIRPFSYSGYFNGIDNYMSLASALPFAINNATVSFWGKQQALDITATSPVFSLGTGNWYFGFANKNALIASYINAAVVQKLATGGLITKQQWTHYAATFALDGSGNNTVTLYVNGTPVVVFTEAGGGRRAVYGTNAVIGAFTASSSFWNGFITDMRVHSATLTQAQIQQICYQGTEPLVANLLSRWMWSEGSGTTTADVTGNGNTATWGGTLGNQWSTDVPMIARSAATGRSTV